jgi:hypothetical protein
MLHRYASLRWTEFTYRQRSKNMTWDSPVSPLRYTRHAALRITYLSYPVIGNTSNTLDNLTQ